MDYNEIYNLAWDRLGFTREQARAAAEALEVELCDYPYEYNEITCEETITNFIKSL